MNRKLAFLACYGAMLLVLEICALAVLNSASLGDGRFADARAFVPARPASAEPRDTARDAWAARALARPLFSPARRPDPAGAPAHALIGQRAAPPRLTGVASSPDGRYAIFEPEPGVSISVSEGGALGVWRVIRIDAEGVTVSDGGENLLLHTQFSQSPAGAKPLPAAVAARPRDAAGRHVPPPGFLERLVR